jgi:hypothetical protein
LKQITIQISVGKIWVNKNLYLIPNLDQIHQLLLSQLFLIFGTKGSIWLLIFQFIDI